MSEMQNPFHVTGGWLGRPGERTFYLQAEDEHGLVTVLVEKAQVEGLSELLARVLTEVDASPVTDWDRDAMRLREPVDPCWRLGTLGVGIDAEAGRVVIELNEFLPEGDDEPEQLRWWLDLDLARRTAAHCREVVGQGRPTCELCGRPTAPDGAHVCPRAN